VISKTLGVAATAFLAVASLSVAASDWQNNDPKQWNCNDVYQILNNSPWSKTVKTQITNAKDPADALGNQSSGGSTPPPPNTGGYGGGGRRGGYGASSRTYSSGGGGSQGKPTTSSAPPPTEVTIQWQSALPVQMAAAKKVVNDADVSNIKPLDNYVVAVIGLPIRALGGRAASVDSDQTLDPDEEKNLEERLKTDTELIAGGHEALHPVKVELNQGVDGRILLYFPKNEPITLGEKTVEFKLRAGHTKIEKKFVLKDMEFKGQLEL
jgi:hypothetical protein